MTTSRGRSRAASASSAPPRNLGFGAGNNVGIREARGRYVILLNNDAVAAPRVRAGAGGGGGGGPRVGMVAARVLDYSRRDVLDTVGHLLYPDGLNRGRGRLDEDRGQYDACRTALFPSGAAALYTRRMLDDIGLFDERLFLYGDDAELGTARPGRGLGVRAGPASDRLPSLLAQRGRVFEPEGLLRRAEPRPRPVPDRSRRR